MQHLTFYYIKHKVLYSQLIYTDTIIIYKLLSAKFYGLDRSLQKGENSEGQISGDFIQLNFEVDLK